MQRLSLRHWFDGPSPLSTRNPPKQHMHGQVLDRAYGKACDVWSLGVILHIILSGLPPFSGANDSETFRAVRHEVRQQAGVWGRAPRGEAASGVCVCVCATR